VYVLTVNSKPANKSRLDRKGWLEAALAELAEGGINAIAIEKLASKLGVTRGSFYHHFQDREELQNQMLEYWVERWTMEIRTEMTALGLDARQTLLALMRMIRHRKAAEYDVAFRAWALNDPMARKVVKRVDEIRLDYIRGLFGQLGFDELEAENRARLFLYYEMTEPAMFAAQSKETIERLVEARHRLLTSGPDREIR
jgi:AcrR family transcriptional regulator